MIERQLPQPPTLGRLFRPTSPVRALVDACFAATRAGPIRFRAPISVPASTPSSGCVTITIEVGSTTLSRLNFSGYVGHLTIFIWKFNIACCLILGLGLELRLGLDLVSGGAHVYAYLYYFRLSLSHCTIIVRSPLHACNQWRLIVNWKRCKPIV